MYQYLNAFTNRSGDALPGYFARLFDAGGNVVDLFADNNGTPIASVSGVTNAAVSDENGMFRWFVGNGTYDLRFYDANDVFVSVESGVPMFDAGALTVDLSGTNGATMVGTPTGTVQDDIDARPTSGDLASPTGGEMVGFQQAGTGTEPVSISQAVARIFHATDLGALGNDTGDDGAILTAAIEARFGTLASSQSTEPVRIEFGDSRYTYRLATPIVVQQNYIELVANGAVLNCQSIANAIRYDFDASANIVFGAFASGFTLAGTITGDGILVKSGSQCGVKNIVNKAAITGGIVHYTGTIASWTENIRHDNEGSGSTGHVLKESALQKTPGNYFACIANRHVGAVGYDCQISGIFFSESDGFIIAGADIEKANGPGVDLLNCRFGYVDIYAEINGQTATNVGTDTPDDIRIRSAAGNIVSRSANITVSGSRCAGQTVGGVTPNNVHIVGGDDCLVIGNNLGGNMRNESGCERNNFGVQTRFIGSLTDAGSNTIDRSTAGKQTFKVSTSTRLDIDAYASGGSKIGSPQALLRLYGITSFGPGTTAGSNLAGFETIVDANTTGSVTFGTPEPDANYIVFFQLWDVSGGSATWSVKLTGRNGSGFTFDLDAAPGAGKTVRVHWMILRVG